MAEKAAGVLTRSQELPCGDRLNPTERTIGLGID
jgi:hypothetical protein